MTSPKGKMTVLLPMMALPFLTIILYRGGPVGVSAEPSSPNFILILTDDQGYGDLGIAGHPYARTPHLDRMASRGTYFRQFHVTGNVCPTTRAGFMTSKNPSYFPNYTRQYGLTGADTVTKMLQRAGYHVGHLGKWHIGNDVDNERVEYGIDTYERGGMRKDDPRGREGVRFDRAIEFVEQNQDRPFYLQIWTESVHTPIISTEQLLKPFENLTVNPDDFDDPYMTEKLDVMKSRGMDIDKEMREYLADLSGIDDGVGRLLDRIDELGLAETTLIAFTSDNGPQGPSADPKPSMAGWGGGLRGEKHEWHEAGTRVPLIIQWKGAVPAGKVNDRSIMFGLDWLPSVGVLAGADVPWNRIEGEDVSDIWKGADRSRANPLLFRNPTSLTSPVVRYGRWKFIRDKNELYDLDADPTERNNVYKTRSDIVEPLSDVLYEWIETLPDQYAREPSDALPFDPNLTMKKIGPPKLPGETPTTTPTTTPKPDSIPLPPTPPPSSAPTKTPPPSPGTKDSPISSPQPTDVPTTQVPTTLVTPTTNPTSLLPVAAFPTLLPLQSDNATANAALSDAPSVAPSSSSFAPRLVLSRIQNGWVEVLSWVGLALVSTLLF